VLRSADDGGRTALVETLRANAAGTADRCSDVEEAHSYDMHPPEGSVGAALWVHADDVGQAATTGLTAVHEVCEAVVGRRLPLWDLRVIPRDAITMAAEAGESLAAPHERARLTRRDGPVSASADTPTSHESRRTTT
jgi:hypothetical protein